MGVVLPDPFSDAILYFLIIVSVRTIMLLMTILYSNEIKVEDVCIHQEQSDIPIVFSGGKVKEIKQFFK